MLQFINSWKTARCLDGYQFMSGKQDFAKPNINIIITKKLIIQNLKWPLNKKSS